MAEEMKINHGIVIVSKESVLGKTEQVDVIHFVGYENPPTFYDYLSVYKEIATDESLGLTKIADDLLLMPASEDALEHFKNALDG